MSVLPRKQRVRHENPRLMTEYCTTGSLFNVRECPQDKEVSDLVWVLNVVRIPSILNKAAITSDQ